MNPRVQTLQPLLPSWIIKLVAVIVLFLVSSVGAQDLEFLERFALSTDREAVLKQLVPGTEPYYYFHALHYQTTEQLDKVDTLLTAWRKRFKNSRLLQRIENRQQLLKYSDTPQETLDFIKTELGLNFNHQREVPQAQRKLKTALDESKIEIEALLKQALRQPKLNQVSDNGLRYLDGASLTPTQRRELLQRLDQPQFPHLLELIDEDLRDSDSRGFGSLAIHKALTLDQLQRLSAAKPELIQQDAFVYLMISKLVPGNDTHPQLDRDEARKFLELKWKFVRDLAPRFNSLKANILFQQLTVDWKAEKPDKAKFLQFVQLPRNVAYVNPAWIRRFRDRTHLVQLNKRLGGSAGLPPIGNDEPLVQKYLQYFLRDANDYREFEPYLSDTYLKRQFATAKILAGIGEVEKWASMLSPAEYQRLLKRIDLEFTPSRQTEFAVDEAVQLELYTKNVGTLIVKTFEVNAENFYKKHLREVDTDINLDGLVPNNERSFEFSDPPALRKRRKFDFPELTGPGVYVIDFIAGGKSSRALIRKGRLQFLSQANARGQELTVMNSQFDKVQDATVWLGGRRYYPDPQGKIQIPFSTQPGMVQAIISRGKFCSLQNFFHRTEAYRFRAAMLLDRESLIRSNKASVIIRPLLTLDGLANLTLTRLQSPKLTITTTNQDGITSTQTLSGLKLMDQQETRAEFVVPPRLKEIRLVLQAKVKRLSDQKEVSVDASQVFQVNQIDASDFTQDVHLAPTEAGYVLEVRGKSGEPRPGQAVRVTLKHDAVKFDVNVDLQSDAAGTIALGSLAGIRQLSVKPARGQAKQWSLGTQEQTYQQALHVAKGSMIELPAPAGMQQVSRRSISLFEIRQGKIVRDLFSSVKLKRGLVQIADLPPGDFRLRMTPEFATASGRSRFEVSIRVSQGKSLDDALVSSTRQLQITGSRGTQISRIEQDLQNLKIQLENASPATRVIVIASRYQPAFNSFRALAQIASLEPWSVTPALRRSVYREGRTIGDEYEYILRRKYASKFPGNMLERPSLLLNPWAVRETSNQSQEAAGGNKFGQSGNDAEGKPKSEPSRASRIGNPVDFANLNFLPEGSRVLANLKANPAGIISIDRKQLGTHQHIRVIALTGNHTVERVINGPLSDFQPSDSRLANALNPKQHFTLAKQADVLSEGNFLAVKDLVSAKFKKYDDRGDVYQLLRSLNNDAALGDFEFVLKWSQMKPEQKQVLYSKYACHELNFFIAQKDRPFFQRVVLPHLKNKRILTFMDQFLLGKNLEAYTAPRAFEQLNMVEKILLAQRLEDRSSDLIRRINDAYLVAPTPRDQIDRLFDHSIASTSNANDSFASKLDLERQKLSEAIRKVPRSGRVEGLPGLEAGTAWRSGGVSGGRTGKSLAVNGQPMFRQFSGEQQRYRIENRTRSVPVTRERLEIRTRQMPNGKTESYEVAVPYTEQVTQNYTVQVPYFTSPAQQAGDGDADGLPKAPDDGLVIGGGIVREGKEAGFWNGLYRRTGETQEWIEHNYYHLMPDQETPERVSINQFWRDYANHQGGQFLSPNFAEAHRTFTEIMFAIAVLDLPETAPTHDLEFADNSMTFKAGGSAIVLHQQVKGAEFARGDTKVLVSENFFQKNDRYQFKNGVRYDKFVNDQFLAHTLYGGQVVITNPTSTPIPIDLLIQIPQGAVACSGAQETRTIQVNLEAFSTKTFEYFYYFPTPGAFEHYPAHVASKGTVLAVAEARRFQVVDRQPEIDKSSWEFVSQNGTADQVIDFLNDENLLRVDLAKIAFRMKDKQFFQRAMQSLRNRYVYESTLWSYGIRHDDQPTIREFLSYDNSISLNCGLAFRSDLLTVDPVERNWYAHKEYWPLVNSRAHQLGPQRKILNPDFAKQYRQLLERLSNERELGDQGHLVITYYMLLQDRIDAALTHFKQVAAGKIDSRLQYDYCDAYLDFYREKPREAAAKAGKWVDYPVDHWRKRFQALLAQVDEIQGAAVKVVDEADRQQAQTAMADKSESVDLIINGGLITVRARNVTQLDVNFYEMDIELLFSRSPFAQDQLDGFSMIRPNESQTLELKLDDQRRVEQEIELPPSLKNKNVLVEVVAGDQARSQPFFAHSLDVKLQENFGQLQVLEDASGKPISKAYVKVYARTSSGKIRFHKDGYTDLRGRFDYVSQSNRSIDDISKLSILILSDQHGAVVRQAIRPKE